MKNETKENKQQTKAEACVDPLLRNCLCLESIKIVLGTWAPKGGFHYFIMPSVQRTSASLRENLHTKLKKKIINREHVETVLVLP